MCKLGQRQSPINIVTSEVQYKNLSPLEFHYQSIPLNVLNDGYTIHIDAPEGSTLSVNGRVCKLLQFHFHTPAEHTIDSQQGEMELHFVHKDPKGKLAVVGVIMEVGQCDNPTIEEIWKIAGDSKF